MTFLATKKSKPSRCYHHPGGSQTMKELYHILCGHIATDTYHHSVGSWGPATLLEQNMSPPKVCLKLSVPFSQAGICIRSLEGYIHMYSFLTSQLRVWNFMEDKTIFGPIIKAFKGHIWSREPPSDLPSGFWRSQNHLPKVTCYSKL